MTNPAVFLLGRVSVIAGNPAGGNRPFQVVFQQDAGKVGSAESVLLGLHYYTHVLSRYPRTDSKLDRFGMELRQMVADIVEQGIWPGTNVIRYAGIADRIRLVSVEQKLEGGKEICGVLFRTTLGNGLDLGLEVSAAIEESTLVDSVVAVLQALTNVLHEPMIELLDKALRRLRVYIGEGAEYGDPAAAQALANRAFEDAGGVLR